MPPVVRMGGARGGWWAQHQNVGCRCGGGGCGELSPSCMADSAQLNIREGIVSRSGANRRSPPEANCATIGMGAGLRGVGVPENFRSVGGPVAQWRASVDV